MVLSSTFMFVLIAVLSLVIGLILGVFAALLWVDYIRKDKSPKRQSGMVKSMPKEGKETIEMQKFDQTEMNRDREFQELVRFGYVGDGRSLGVRMDDQIYTDLGTLSKQKADELRLYLAGLNTWMNVQEPSVKDDPSPSESTVQIRHGKKGKKNASEKEH